MYIDRSPRAKKDKLIVELNFKNFAIKEITENNFFVGITNKQKIHIIHPYFMVDNKEITDQFIQNLKKNQTSFKT